MTSRPMWLPGRRVVHVSLCWCGVSWAAVRMYGEETFRSMLRMSVLVDCKAVPTVERRQPGKSELTSALT